MKAIKDLLNSVNSLHLSTEIEDFVITDFKYAKPNREVEMSRGEANRKLEQYYNKFSGCSVKAQKDNLFDYSSILEG